MYIHTNTHKHMAWRELETWRKTRVARAQRGVGDERFLVVWTLKRNPTLVHT